MAINVINPKPLPLTVNGTTQHQNALGSFGKVLEDALNKVNAGQVQADQLLQQFLAGNVQDVSQVMVAMQEARLTMDLAIQVRNKIVEAYQEISRMQI